MDNLNNLPAEIISDVLTCLPAETVLDCKLVSKTWRDLIKHPLFYKMHTNRLINHSATAAYSTDSGKLGFLALAQDKKLYYFEYVENHNKPIDNFKNIILTPPIQNYKYNYVGSFNGLICLRAVGENIFMYNPMTKEYVFLPQPTINFYRIKQRWFGFGYLPSTGEYKVVLMYKVPKFVEVIVYTLGSGNGWRNIGQFKLEFNYVYEGHGVFVNGALHWMHNARARARRMILVFDLADEKFCEHLSPPLVPIACNYLVVGVLGGFLFCADRHFCSVSRQYVSSDIWVYKKNNDNYSMKELDEHRSLGWSKVFTNVYSIPLAFTKSGDVLTYSLSFLSIYDAKSSTLKKILVPFKEQFCQISPHRNTFGSLKELGEGNAKTVESVKTKKRKSRDYA
ncbi:F-box/kelch-repeat protein At3g06240-like [Papaver somniferum]|uniref:F-box/kelch-repeat protein At3g06240-like n=1 Tax=Papaver somniferum TaxID=3469 RepID=UPI000E6F6CA7|nr:F-box/kelch-repeat protein At3g06240-like [Papaver somniferum]